MRTDYHGRSGSGAPGSEALAVTQAQEVDALDQSRADRAGLGNILKLASQGFI